jgi:hypothetical protein
MDMPMPDYIRSNDLLGYLFRKPAFGRQTSLAESSQPKALFSPFSWRIVKVHACGIRGKDLRVVEGDLALK